MTVQEDIKILEDMLEGSFAHSELEKTLALAMAINVLKALSPVQVETVNAIYSINFTPELKF